MFTVDYWLFIDYWFVYKHRPCDDSSNYRTISVVPFIAKILVEKLVASQLNSYCEENQLWVLIKVLIVVVGLLVFCLVLSIDTILNALDHHQIMFTAFLDLRSRNAFDSLDHIVLLEHLTITEILLARYWISAVHCITSLNVFNVLRFVIRSPHDYLLKVVFPRTVPLVHWYFSLNFMSM